MKFIVDELPNCCYHCICSSLHNTRPECNFIGTLNREDWKIKRDKNCPLRELFKNEVYPVPSGQVIKNFVECTGFSEPKIPNSVKSIADELEELVKWKF